MGKTFCVKSEAIRCLVPSVYVERLSAARIMPSGAATPTTIVILLTSVLPPHRREHSWGPTETADIESFVILTPRSDDRTTRSPPGGPAGFRSEAAAEV